MTEEDPLGATSDLVRSITDTSVHRPSPRVGQIVPSLYQQDTYSDMTLRCEDRSWRLHKLVMCTMSPVIRARFSQAWDRGDDEVFADATNAPTTVSCMIQFCYTGNYDCQPVSDAQNDVISNLNATLVEHIRICSVADVYDVPSLAQLARRKMYAQMFSKPVAQNSVGFARVIEAFEVAAPNDKVLRALINWFALRSSNILLRDKSFLESMLSKQHVHDFYIKFMMLYVEYNARGGRFRALEAQA